MKERISKVVAILSLLLAVMVAPAGAVVPEVVIVDVPFGFSVGEKMMPAGRYQIRRVNDRDLFRIRGVGNGKYSSTFLTVVEGGGTVNRDSAVVFRSYGDRRYLSLIRVGGDNVGFALPPSKQERKITRHLALQSTAPEEVTIAAR